MILIRHGQSEFNAIFNRTRIDPGIPDPRLTTDGRRQVAAAAELLRERGIRHLISSPYTRAIETATIIAEALAVPITIDPVVRERFAFSCDIGRPATELARHWPALDFDHLPHPWWHDTERHGPEETEGQLHQRGQSFRVRMAARMDWSEVGVVTHWGFIRALTGRTVTNAELVPFDPTI
jgi:broad specificity phosphatase PhoE